MNFVSAQQMLHLKVFSNNKKSDPSNKIQLSGVLVKFHGHSPTALKSYEYLLSGN